MINHDQSQRHGISARKQIPTKWEQTSFHSVHHTLIWHLGNNVDIVSMSSVLFLFQSYLAAFSARASVGVCVIKAFLVFYLLHHSYFCHFQAVFLLPRGLGMRLVASHPPPWVCSVHN